MRAELVIGSVSADDAQSTYVGRLTMKTVLLTAFASVAFLSGAQAASVDALKGDVFLSSKKGFYSVKTSTTGWPGQTVLVKNGGFARVICSPSRAYEMAGPGRFKIPADCKNTPATKK